MNIRKFTASVATVALLAGCGGGGNSRASTVPPAVTTTAAPTAAATGTTATSPTLTTTAPTSVQDAITTARLKAALLTVNEMPTGFSLSSPSDDSSTDAPGTTACAKRYAELSRSDSKSTAVKADRTFDQGGLTGTYVDQELTAFRSAIEAQVSVTRLTNVVSQCPKFTSIDKGGARSEYTLAALSFPKLGDQTFAAKLTVESKDLTVLGQVVITRDGPLVQLVTAGSLTGPSIEITEKIVRAGYAKLHLLR